MGNNFICNRWDPAARNGCHYMIAVFNNLGFDERGNQSICHQNLKFLAYSYKKPTYKEIKNEFDLHGTVVGVGGKRVPIQNRHILILKNGTYEHEIYSRLMS